MSSDGGGVYTGWHWTLSSGGGGVNTVLVVIMPVGMCIVSTN